MVDNIGSSVQTYWSFVDKNAYGFHKWHCFDPNMKWRQMGWFLQSIFGIISILGGNVYWRSLHVPEIAVEES